MLYIIVLKLRRLAHRFVA